MSAEEKPVRLGWRRNIFGLVFAWTILAAPLLCLHWSWWSRPEPAYPLPPGPEEILPLSGRNTAGVTFLAPEDGLSGLEATLVPPVQKRRMWARLTLYLLGPDGRVSPRPEERAPVRRAVVHLKNSPERQTVKFQFRPVEFSRGGYFYAAIAGQEAGPKAPLGLVAARSQGGTAEMVGQVDGQDSPLAPRVSLLFTRPPGWLARHWWFLVLGPAWFFLGLALWRRLNSLVMSDQKTP